MKKAALLTTMLSMLIASFCLPGYADEMGAQITVLEQKAVRIQSQIEQAKKQSEAAIDQRVKALGTSIESLLQQRVQIDAQIAQLEGQIQEAKKSNQSNLGRQIQQYDVELAQVKQQIAGLQQKAAQPKPVVPPAVTPVPKSAPVNPAQAPMTSAMPSEIGVGAQVKPECPACPAATVPGN